MVGMPVQPKPAPSAVSLLVSLLVVSVPVVSVLANWPAFAQVALLACTRSFRAPREELLTTPRFAAYVSCECSTIRPSVVSHRARMEIVASIDVSCLQRWHMHSRDGNHEAFVLDLVLCEPQPLSCTKSRIL